MSCARVTSYFSKHSSRASDVSSATSHGGYGYDDDDLDLDY